MATRRILVYVIMYVPWICLLLMLPFTLYWLNEPVPLVIQYSADKFTKEPVRTRLEADKFGVTALVGGRVAYRYVEFCVSKPVRGISERSWVGESIVWPAPTVALTITGKQGCFAESFPIAIPSSSPSRLFHFQQISYVDTNIIRIDAVPYEPISLFILSPEEAAKQ